MPKSSSVSGRSAQCWGARGRCAATTMGGCREIYVDGRSSGGSAKTYSVMISVWWRAADEEKASLLGNAKYMAQTTLARAATTLEPGRAAPSPKATRAIKGRYAQTAFKSYQAAVNCQLLAATPPSSSPKRMPCVRSIAGGALAPVSGQCLSKLATRRTLAADGTPQDAARLPAAHAGAASRFCDPVAVRDLLHRLGPGVVGCNIPIAPAKVASRNARASTCDRGSNYRLAP